MIYSSRVTALLLAIAVSGCNRDVAAPRPPSGPDGQPTIVLQASQFTARPGERVVIRTGAVLPGTRSLAAFSGTLRFDASRLRYVGQPLEGQTLVLVNPAEPAGQLRVLAYNPLGLPTAPVELVFDVLGSDYLRQLEFQFSLGGTSDLSWFHSASPALRIDPLSTPASTVLPRALSSADWATQLQWTPVKPQAIPARSPGQGVVYGDVTLNGTVDLFDILFVANLTVGLQPLLTDLGKDYVIAGDVAPFNLPGLGEPTDPVPPGLDPDGTHTIDLFDLLPIGNEVAGVDQPVVGELIPGRAIAAARAVVSGTIASNRTFFRDSVYELRGRVDVAGSVRLTIESGTRIEGDGATRGALVVRRGGRLDARGTRLSPIIFTCTAPLKSRGCWGGVVLNGFSLLNNGIPGTGGVDVMGCPERTSIGNPGLYGGCLVQDTSGVLRYVRIEFAGMAPQGQGPAPGLALLGTGSGTAIDSVQVRESLGDGLFISGGTVDLRAIILTDNLGAGLSWDDGWVGRGQSLIVQQGSDGREGLLGSDAAMAYSARPLSQPQLYGVTVIGPPAGGPTTAPGILLHQGSGGIIRNLIVLRPSGSGLDINNAESCALASGTGAAIKIDHAIFFGGTPDFSDDTDCIDEAAYAQLPARSNRQIDPGLLGPFVSQSPDLRPTAVGAAAAGGLAPPSDGFFDVTNTWLGAVPPAGLGSTVIPWYAGWTVGWP